MWKHKLPFKPWLLNLRKPSFNLWSSSVQATQWLSPAHIAELLTVLMAALFAGPRWPWAGDWQWGIGPDTDNAHYHNLNEVSTTGNVSPYLNGGSAKTTKTLIVTSQSQPAESGASWSHQWPGCRAAAVGNVGNVGCFPNWAAEQNTEHRTDLSRTKTKGCPGSGRGEGASSRQP